MKTKWFMALFVLSVALISSCGNGSESQQSTQQVDTTISTTTSVVASSTILTTTTTSSPALFSCKRTWNLWKGDALSDRRRILMGWMLSTEDCSRAEWIAEATALIEASRAGDKLGDGTYLRWALSGAGGKTAEQYLDEACGDSSFAAQGFPLGDACLK